MEIKESKMLIFSIILVFILNVFSFSNPEKTRGNFDISIKRFILNNYLLFKHKISNLCEDIILILSGDLPSKRLSKGD